MNLHIRDYPSKILKEKNFYTSQAIEYAFFKGRYCDISVGENFPPILRHEKLKDYANKLLQEDFFTEYQRFNDVFHKKKTEIATKRAKFLQKEGLDFENYTDNSFEAYRLLCETEEEIWE